jgi:hypothetical protein
VKRLKVRCPKCGSKSVALSYRMAYPPKSDSLEAVCTTCRYRWEAPPLDALREAQL